MIQELIDAVNAYRLEHSKCEATGHRTSELNDTYVRMLLVCDAAQHSVQLTASGDYANEHLLEYNQIREQAGLPKLGGN